jgi:uncharacterized tellurite resistance protein B-like protein
MSLLRKFFVSFTNQIESKLDLQRNIENILVGEDEQTVLKITAISGVMARVICCNLKVEAAEIKFASELLAHDFLFDQFKVESLLNLAVQNVESFIDRDFYQYNKIINQMLNNDEKYKLLITLFKIAASDGKVENTESEDLRFITQGFNLSHQHFISARAVVADFLAASKNN